MKSWKLYCTGLVLAAGLAPAALAQGLPAITPPPGVPIAPQTPPVNAPVPPAAAPPNIWDKLCPRADQKAACRAKICNSRIGQLLNNMLQPAGAMSGGIIGPFCPTISAADLAKPPDSSEGAAARLKLDQADAAARREAIRYMAGADCHYWPEVTEALIGSLRADRNECVRLEAALALGRGCCCNRATMKALTLTLSGSTEDGNPAEDSERVKMAAMAALNHCLANFTEVVPAPEPVPEPVKPDHGGEPIPPKGEPLPPPKPGETVPPPMPKPMTQGRPFSPTEFYHHAENLEEKKVVAEARRAVEHVTPVAAEAPSPAADHTLFGIARAAITPPSGPVVQAAVAIDRPTAQPQVVPAVMVQPAKSSPPPAAVPAAPSPVAPATYFPAAEKATPAVEKKTVPAQFAPPIEKATPQVQIMPPPSAVLVPTLAPTKPAPAASAGMGATAIAEAIGVLRDSIKPEERAKAAATLGGCDAWTNPNVVQALIEAARSDADPPVRAACLRSLTRLNVRTLPVATIAQALRTDPDPRVRTEAESVLKQITGSMTPNAQ